MAPASKAIEDIAAQESMRNCYHDYNIDESSALTHNFESQRGKQSNNSIMTTVTTSIDISVPKDEEVTSSIDISVPKDEEVTSSKRSANIKKILIAIPIISMILFAIVDSQTNQYIKTAFDGFLNWMSTHLIAGIFALIAVYAFATVIGIPGSLLTLGSGFVYGNTLGLGLGVAVASCVVFVGASIGAILSFLLGRYLLRDWVGERFVKRYPVFKALDEGKFVYSMSSTLFLTKSELELT